MNEDLAKKITYGFTAIMVVVVFLMVVVLQVLHVKNDMLGYFCLGLGLLSIPFFYIYRHIILQREGAANSNNLSNPHLNGSTSDNGTVDIFKLSYTNSQPFINNGSADDPINKVQYVRFVAIIAILESIMVDNIKNYNQTWLAIASFSVILILFVGIKMFKSVVKSFFLLFVSTAITYVFYYLKIK